MVETDYARAGSIASRSAIVTTDMLQTFPISMMEQFRKLGMPVEIKNGQIILHNGLDNYQICKVGEVLSVEKCKLLVHFDMKLSGFKVALVCCWSSNGEFEPLD
jgi:mRNA turnover protein 4